MTAADVAEQAPWLKRRAVEILLAAMACFASVYFFTGGSWNASAHLATTVSIVEHGTLYIDRYRDSTGDIARGLDGTVSSKAIGSALVSVPGFVVARWLTHHVKNPGDRLILWAYLTTAFTMGPVMALFVVVVYRLGRRRLEPIDAAFVALAMVVATPLFPNATMVSQHVMTALAALTSYAMLEALRWPRSRGASVDSAKELGGAQCVGPTEAPNSKRTRLCLFGAGFAAGLAPVFEYPSAIALAPLFFYALACSRPRYQALWFVLGMAVPLSIPLVHHSLVFGAPFATGYDSLVRPEFVAIHRQGFLGFDRFSWLRLYELTFGHSRGVFFLAPFLVAAIPGALRLLRSAETRVEGAVVSAIALGNLGLIACFVNWHSGSAVASRFIHLFIAFSCVPVAAVVRDHRAWVRVGVAIGFFFMLVATSVTAVPPPPGENVMALLSRDFFAGNLSSWQAPSLREGGLGAGAPTLPFAFNLGLLLGLPGLSSLLPFTAVMALLGGFLARTLRVRTSWGPPAQVLAPTPPPVSDSVAKS